jgi:hypothetical protein
MALAREGAAAADLYGLTRAAGAQLASFDTDFPKRLGVEVHPV